jgi:hypothetical protein
MKRNKNHVACKKMNRTGDHFGSDISQIQKNKHHMFSLVCDEERDKTAVECVMGRR